MEIETLSPEFSISPQILPKDLAAIKSAGFRAIICNRPDSETPDQPAFAEIERAARTNGVEARYVPVDISGVTPDDVNDFAAALTDLPRPVLAYCRSGKRSAALWSRLSS